jgi:tRNA A37 threonylcarbamoyladenosine synthetase subunit TsaC/SUA5/YrdC
MLITQLFKLKQLLHTHHIILSQSSLDLINSIMENIMLKLGDLLNLVKYPSLTEKSINLYGDRQYTFIVDRSLTKTQIKYIIEKIF